MLLIHIYFSCVTLAFLASLVSFKWNYPFHLKMFSVLLGMTFLTELFAIYISKIYNWNNVVIYNVFMLIDFMGFAFFYLRIIEVRWIKIIIRAFLFLFPVWWFVSVFLLLGIGKWNSYIVVSGAFFSVCMCLGYYFHILTTEKETGLLRSAEFWIATGMLICYSCQVPYYGTLNYLLANYRNLAISFFFVILVINTLMYVSFTYAYLCSKIIPKRSL